ncbi:MAG: HPr family phosphocarrier protein [Treponema sp.]|jgi:phosphotransferase system HPr (HPr) family protein|nr:HPr family phosphocarrier protein [Treponema sp.]
MTEFSYTITDPVGIHARPAGLFVRKLAEFKSAITISRKDNGASCDGKGLLALMKLKVKQNDAIIVRAEGDDETAAIEAAQAYLSAHL